MYTTYNDLHIAVIAKLWEDKDELYTQIEEQIRAILDAHPGRRATFHFSPRDFDMIPHHVINSINRTRRPKIRRKMTSTVTYLSTDVLRWVCDEYETIIIDPFLRPKHTEFYYLSKKIIKQCNFIIFYTEHGDKEIFDLVDYANECIMEGDEKYLFFFPYRIKGPYF